MLLFNVVLDILHRTIRKEKKLRGVKIGKEKVKLALFSDDVSWSSCEQKETTKMLLKLVFGKVAEQQISMQALTPWYDELNHHLKGSDLGRLRFRSQLFISAPVPAVTSGRAVEDAPRTWAPVLKWGTQIKLLTPRFDLALPCHFSQLESEPDHRGKKIL